MNEDAFVQAIEEFEAARLSPATAGLDLCALYVKIKPILTGILPFLKLIPKFGETVSEALSALMAALDKLCPASIATSAAKA